jgi:hypothetical protein
VLPLPPNMPPGKYHLEVGVYYWQTLERLFVMENGSAVKDFVEMGGVGIQ